MAIIGTPVGAASSLTLGALVQWGLRRFGDSRAERDALVVRECAQAALDRVALAGEWPWYNQVARVMLKGIVSPGTAAVTRDSDNVILNDTVVDDTLVGGFLKVGADEYDIEIQDVDVATNSVTLAEAYPGTTDATATVEVRFDRYALPADWRQGMTMLTSSWGAAQEASLDDWHQARQDRMAGGRVILVAQDGVTLYVAPIPASDGVLSYAYRRWPTRPENDGDVLDLPRQLEAMVYAALLAELAREGHQEEMVPLREAAYDQSLRAARVGQRGFTGSSQREAAGTVVTEEWGRNIDSVLRIPAGP